MTAAAIPHFAPPLFECWAEVAARLAGAPIVALFLDFDGTLAPLCERPEEAGADDTTRDTLAALARSRRVRVCVISGRRRADVRARVGVPGVRYLGLFGYDDGGDIALPPETRNAMVLIWERLASRLAGSPNVWIEPKAMAMAVHHRGASLEEASRARHAVEQIVEPFSGLFRIGEGRGAWDVIPLELGDKGSAVIRELGALPPGALPVYAGDDRADERAFAALQEGITVRVGPLGWNRSRTLANYRLETVKQVRLFLQRLKEELA